MTLIILGTGIIGTSTAYYLSQSQTPSSIHLVESSPTLFASASGYAGGFLAKDWFAPPVTALGALSFEEHRQLAEQHNGRENWGYSKSTGTSYSPRKGTTMGAENGTDWLRHGTSRAEAAAVSVSECVDESEEEAPSWLRRVHGDTVEVISEEGSTAQVDPLRLSHFLLSQCLARGVQLHHPATAISVAKDMRDELSSLRIAFTESSHEIDIPCTHLIIAAGAWSPSVFQTLFPDAATTLPISSLAGHSLVVRSPRWTREHDETTRRCHAVFTTDAEAGYAPELFSRRGEEIYVAGLNSSSLSLPSLATESQIDDAAVLQLRTTARRLLGLADVGDDDDLEVVRTGLCFRPVTDRGTPILGRIADEVLGGSVSTRGGGDGGVFLAAGHGPWGISMGLGTGKVMAEMVMGLETSVDVAALGL